MGHMGHDLREGNYYSTETQTVVCLFANGVRTEMPLSGSSPMSSDATRAVCTRGRVSPGYDPCVLFRLQRSRTSKERHIAAAPRVIREPALTLFFLYTKTIIAARYPRYCSRCAEASISASSPPATQDTVMSKVPPHDNIPRISPRAI